MRPKKLEEMIGNTFAADAASQLAREVDGLAAGRTSHRRGFLRLVAGTAAGVAAGGTAKAAGGGCAKHDVRPCTEDVCEQGDTCNFNTCTASDRCYVYDTCTVNTCNTQNYCVGDDVCNVDICKEADECLYTNTCVTCNVAGDV